MKTRQLKKSEIERLCAVSDEAEAEFKLLFEHFSGMDFVLANVMNDDIPDEIAAKISNAVSRRLSFEPCQYIIGEQFFMGHRFSVSPAVLIPRADTEIICESVIDCLNKSKQPAKVLDLCTGSGCIGISIAAAVKNCTVDCADISVDALEVAKKNAELNNVSDRVNLIHSDMLTDCSVYDVIVSNPPYIPKDVVLTLDEKVKGFEPHSALDGGNDGLDFYRIIANEAPKHLKNASMLFLEIGYDQKDSVSGILRASGFSDIEVKKDYSGNYRMISCCKK